MEFRAKKDWYYLDYGLFTKEMNALNEISSLINQKINLSFKNKIGYKNRQEWNRKNVDIDRFMNNIMK